MGSSEILARAGDMMTLATAGGFDTVLSPAPKVFQINEDKPITIVTAKGNQRTFPAGSFNTKQIILCGVKKFTSQTQVGSQAIILYYD